MLWSAVSHRAMDAVLKQIQCSNSPGVNIHERRFLDKEQDGVGMWGLSHVNPRSWRFVLMGALLVSCKCVRIGSLFFHPDQLALVCVQLRQNHGLAAK